MEKSKYKVLLESVTQEKKQLRSIPTFREQAPPGYTFVPVGVRSLTELCKELSRQRSVGVYVVSTPSNEAIRNSQSLANHVGRLGHHFRNDIVDKAFVQEGHSLGHRTIWRNGLDVEHGSLGTAMIAQKLEQHGMRMGLLKADISAKDRNAQVRETIKELFPKIPADALDAIVARAWEAGTGRIGDAVDIPLPKRVQLAVVAHIRHVHTNYDSLLRIVRRHEARRIVEQPCLDQIMKWRGEDIKHSNIELEDSFREIIILDESDDEQEVPEAESRPRQAGRQREPSLEIVEVRTITRQPAEVRTIVKQASEARTIVKQPKRLFEVDQTTGKVLTDARHVLRERPREEGYALRERRIEEGYALRERPMESVYASVEQPPQKKRRYL